MPEGARFADVADLAIDAALGVVYEHGWQSWSPAGLYAVHATSPRPQREIWQTMAFRPEVPAPPTGFQAEGLLAVQAEPDGPVELFAAPDPTVAVPSIRATRRDGRLVVSSDGPVEHTRDDGPLPEALERWASRVATAAGLPTPSPIEPGWCSWYCYWNEVTQEDVVAELAAIDELELAVATVQIDDGWQAGIGDWTSTSPRFRDMSEVADRIQQAGRRAGIWTAPFLVGEASATAAAHPEWLVDGALACERHWEQPIRVLDVTHPAAAEHLHDVFSTLRGWGYAYFKVDFLYAGAMVGGRHGDADPIAAYREGMRIIRSAIGPDAILLGCGAPLLPSIGLVDAMRVSPDVDPKTQPPQDDISQPALRSALWSGRARAFQHDLWWVNDPDCVLVRPEVTDREAWARHCAALGGLAVSSDPLRALDARGIELTRALLQPSRHGRPTWEPHAPSDVDGPSQGTLRPR